MPNLRIIHDNVADRATLTASSQAASLGPANLQSRRKTAVLRATGTAQTITATWPTQEVIACVALFYTNLTSTARMRVRAYAQPGDAVPVLDTGWTRPCCEAPLGTYPFGELPLGWNAYKWGGANTWARGGGSNLVSWFAAVLVRRLVIEVTGDGTPEGYIEMSRLVAGNYWAPEYNASYGASLQLQDSSEAYRTSAGTASATVGTTSNRLSVDLEHLTPPDRARLMRILRECGPLRPMLFSLFPENADPLLEQDHMIYGRVANLDAVATPYYDGYSAPLEIEGI
ncbi:hypothetical protein [Janthinobacterium aquaticum]|uniref:hypothetical protein n=1 Tax=Janthinobacterium sp. FT58W TaxID=2654254 RepID=UPI00126474B6|nr:hypothetical protein [Janthinobacterium sp. FT58W]KAB8042546.1 hypothetical protein GCM43_13560 [Janthinobacterium sp. FT58W]